MYLKLVKENRKKSTCNRLDLETLGSLPDRAQESPLTLSPVSPCHHLTLR